jgi:hypothetical protein
MKRAVLVVALAACHPHHPPLQSCADPLGGTWTDTSGRAWQIIDRKATVEVYPLFDTAVEPILGQDAGPARAPIHVALPRRGATVDGEASFRLSRGGASCEIKYPFKITGCAGRRATLSYQDVTAVSDGCSAAYAPLWNDVPIVRE